MKAKIVMVLLLAFSLSACHSNIRKREKAYYSTTPVENSLAEASYSVSRSIVDLAETTQAAHPEVEIAPPPNPKSYGMDGLSTVDWSGPIEPLVRQLAKASSYRVSVLGSKPAIPVMVTVYSKNAMLGDILRDVGYQAGKRATVSVYPGSRLIELRYAKN